MVDLQGQYKKIRWQVNREIKKVLKSAAFINGPIVKEFETNLKDFLGTKNVIPCANGTDALQVALMSLGLEKGDEVITTNFSFASTIEVILLLGLKPILVDIDSKTFNIDPAMIKNRITSRTRAIIPVHLYGQSCRMNEVMEIAKENKLFVIEDNAQALGSKVKLSNSTKVMSGTIGDIGTTSFFPSKNLGGYGDGGAIFTNSDDLAFKMRGIVNHGMYKRYYHDVVGVNSRLDSIQAAVLNEKLKLLDSYNQSRKESAEKYSHFFRKNPKIITPKTVGEQDSHVFHQYTLRILGADRDSLGQYLNDNKIPFGVYYPVPLHLQKAYKSSNYLEEDFKVTNKLIDEVISLPMHSELDDEQIQFICKKVLEFLD